MTVKTLTALSQRDEAFWVGLALLFGGALLVAWTPPLAVDLVVLPATLGEGLRGTGWTLMGLGQVIIAVRILVAVFSILGTTVRAGWFGYREGRHSE